MQPYRSGLPLSPFYLRRIIFRPSSSRVPSNTLPYHPVTVSFLSPSRSLTIGHHTPPVVTDNRIPPSSNTGSLLYQQSQTNIHRIIQQSADPNASVPYIFSVCIDGSDPSYHAPSLASSVTPSISSFPSQFIVDGALPTFTNPNNVSLITGTSPREHGISGNYAFMPIDDTPSSTSGSMVNTSVSPLSKNTTSSTTGGKIPRKEVSMVSSSMIRSPNILAEAYRAGFDIIIITAKDKLLNLLSHQLPLNDNVPPQSSIEFTNNSISNESSTVASSSSSSKTDISSNEPFLIRLSLEALSHRILQKSFTASNPLSNESISLVSSLLFQHSSSFSYDGGSTISRTNHTPSLPYSSSASSLAYLSSAEKFPGIYDPFISVGVIDIGNLLARYIYRIRQKNTKKHHRPLLAYLSTTDYVQHKFPPGSKEANEYYTALDRAIGTIGKWEQDSSSLISSSPSVFLGFTADHGMNYKCNPVNGEPNIVYIEELLHDTHGIPNTTILPITDAHVIHHGALGGYCTVYITNANDIPRARSILQNVHGIERVYTQNEAAVHCELPMDRIGDLVIICNRDTVVGKRKNFHNLHIAQIPYLRSHGSTHEQKVPLYFNKNVKVVVPEKNRMNNGKNTDRLRNWHLLPMLLSMASSKQVGTHEYYV